MVLYCKFKQNGCYVQHVKCWCLCVADLGTSFPITASVCFPGGYSDKNHDLTTVRLCFQAFLPDQNGKFCRIVKPVVSNNIYDKSKFTSELGVNL